MKTQKLQEFIVECLCIYLFIYLFILPNISFVILIPSDPVFPVKKSRFQFYPCRLYLTSENHKRRKILSNIILLH